MHKKAMKIYKCEYIFNKNEFIFKKGLTFYAYRCIIMTSTKTRALAARKKEEIKMKKILALILTVALLGCSVFALTSCDGLSTDPLAADYNELLKACKAPKEGANGTLTVAMSPDFAPMEFVDAALTGDAQYVGFDVLLANYIAKELDMSLVIKPMDFYACMTNLQNDKVDLAISGFSWTADRAETFLISDYYIAGENETEQILITKKSDTFDYANATDFSGKKIAAQGGSLQQLLVNEQLVGKGATLVKFDDINLAVTALKNGNVDAVAVAVGNGDTICSANTDLEPSGFFFEVEEKYKNNVVLVNMEDKALLDKVNAVLAKAMASGIYDTWYAACEKYARVGTKNEDGFDEEGNPNT